MALPMEVVKSNRVRLCRRVFATALVSALLMGCGSLSPQTVAAHKIADALPQMLGPARHYDVQVEGDTFALARGRAHRVQVHGEDVDLAPAETLDALDFVAEDVSFDTQAKRLERVGRAEFTGTIGQDHLNAYLAQNRPGLDVTLRSGDVQARIPIVAGPLHTTATVVGTLTPSSPGANTLNFVADRARLSFLPVPAFLVNGALETLNPVVDLSRSKIPIALQSADVVNGALVLHGTANLDSLTNTPPS